MSIFFCPNLKYEINKNCLTFFTWKKWVLLYKNEHILEKSVLLLWFHRFVAIWMLHVMYKTGCTYFVVIKMWSLHGWIESKCPQFNKLSTYVLNAFSSIFFIMILFRSLYLHIFLGSDNYFSLLARTFNSFRRRKKNCKRSMNK